MDRIHSEVRCVFNTGKEKRAEFISVVRMIIQVDTIHSVVRCGVNNTGKNMWTESIQW